jgi:hypothetical protein
MLRHLKARKYIIALVVIFGGAVFVSHQYQSVRKQCQTECNQVKPVSVTASSSTENCNKCEENVEQRFPSWYRLFGWPEGITAWAILLTLLAIAEQTVETRNAAQAARDSIRLQESAMEQWIEVTNWRSQLGDLLPESYDSQYLLLEVDVVNNTSFPITLKRAEMDFINTGDGSSRTYFAGEDAFLAPKVPHVVTVAINIDRKQMSEYPRGGIGVNVAGHFCHIGALKKPVAQELKGLLVCRQTETVFNTEIHMNPKRQEPAGDQNAN